MADMKTIMRWAGNAVIRPTETLDRIRGRRERNTGRHVVSQLEAESLDPWAAGHRALQLPDLGCCSGAAACQDRVSSRLTGAHHHDGGNHLAVILWILVHHMQPATVVETGVARGVSSAFILDAMERNERGHLWSIDLPPLDASWRSQSGIAVDPSLHHRWTYIRGSSRRRLTKVVGHVGIIDLFVHDGLHTTANMLFEMHTAWPSLRDESGILVSDDANCSDASQIFSKTVDTRPLLVRESEKADVVAIWRHDQVTDPPRSISR